MLDSGESIHLPREEAQQSRRPWLTIFWRPIGDSRWDAMLRAAGLVALAAIPIAVWVPERIPIVWFAVLALPATGPISPVMPIALEPLIFEVAKYEAPWLITLVALCIYIYTEYINWHIFKWVVQHDRLTKLRESGLAKRSIGLFGRAPFATVMVFAVSPVPFWPIRVLAILRGYSLRRFMLSMAIGRLPRLYVLAWVGAQLRVSTIVLVAVAALATLAAIVWHRSRKGPAETEAA